MWLSLFLATALLAISVARLAGLQGSSAFNLDLARYALEAPLWRSRLGVNLGLFLLALVALHAALGFLCWLLACFTEFAFPHARTRRRNWVLGWFLACAAWILVANAYWFPHSSLGEPYSGFVRTRFIGTDVLGLTTIVILAAFLVVIVAALWRIATRKVIVAIIALATATAAVLAVDRDARPVAAERPHVVLLGIDSLRPDAIDASNTPNLHAFMSGAVQMTDAITPLARTFPSWASILTGRHPHTTGAYMNLLPRELITTGATLPQILRERGYQTFYAIDEARFSNIDASYGFDTVLTPPMGGSDFVLSRLADTPLSNVVMNTRLGALLFPHVHGNRAASVVYDPDTFVRRIASRLKADRQSMLAIHLALPHWPFTWATSTLDADQGTTEERYRETIQRVDRQFGDLLALLEQEGFLDNALVIALSDHGEALGEPEDFMAEAFPEIDPKANAYQHWGHGTSVFSPSQYRVALGFRAYGRAAHTFRSARPLAQPVSLVDLAPTILELLQLDTEAGFDGVSLAPLLLESSARDESDFTDRIRFTESEYNPQGFDPRKFSTSQLAAAAHIYRLDPGTDRITVRVDMLDEIMSTRQYAAFIGNRAMGAAIPGPGSDGKYEFLYAALPGDSAPDDDVDPQVLASALAEQFKIEFAAIP